MNLTVTVNVELDGETTTVTVEGTRALATDPSAIDAVQAVVRRACAAVLAAYDDAAL